MLPPEDGYNIWVYTLVFYNKKIDKKTKIYLIEKTNNFERNLHIFKIKKYRRHMIFVFAVFIFLSKIVINRYREKKKKKKNNTHTINY
jgi:hypothetical protein